MTKREIKLTAKFKREYKKAIKQQKDTELLWTIVEDLANDIPLEPKYRDHQLKGDKKDFRECHITPDWLLMYRKTVDGLVLVLTELNSHSNMF